MCTELSALTSEQPFLMAKHHRREGGYCETSSQKVGRNFYYNGNSCKSFVNPANTQHLPKTTGKLARQEKGWGAGGVTQRKLWLTKRMDNFRNFLKTELESAGEVFVLQDQMQIDSQQE